MRRFRVLFGSLLGSLVIYLAMASCSSLGPTPANAQQACSQWQVMIVDSKVQANITDTSQIYSRAFDMPSGWEPFGTWGIDVIARRCTN